MSPNGARPFLVFGDLRRAFGMRERRSSDRRRVPQLRAIYERVVRRLTEDHVIEQLDTEDLSGLRKA